MRSNSPRGLLIAALIVVTALSSTGCSKGDEHAQEACKNADYYKHGVCMWGVSCTPPRTRAIGDDAISEATRSTTDSLHDAVTAETTFEAQLAAVFEWCGTG